MQSSLPGPQILKSLGERISRHRLNRNLTQQEVAMKAGIGLATLKRIEQGSTSTQLVNLINVLRVLQLDQNLDLLVPEVPPSPVQLAAMSRKNLRKRARKKLKPESDQDSSPWTWAE